MTRKDIFWRGVILVGVGLVLFLLSCEFSVSHKFHGKTPPGKDSPETNAP